jgi:hypothetical protein
MLRRIAFLLIQCLQILCIWLYITHMMLSRTELSWLVVAILVFFFRAWNLHLIVQMEGDRTVFGKRVERTRLGGFLWGMVGVYAGLLVRSIWKVGVWRFEGLLCGLWVGADVAVLLVARVVTRMPEKEVVVREEDA